MDREVKFKVSQDAGKWLTEKLNGLKAQVTQAETVLQDYKEKENIFLDSEKLSMINQKLLELNSALTMAKNQSH